MNLRDVMHILEAEALSGNDDTHIEIGLVYASDLMSDVLTSATTGTLLITGLTNTQVVRTAEMADLAVVCFVSGKRPQADTIKLAQENNLPLLATGLTMFEACARLQKAGLGDSHE